MRVADLDRWAAGGTSWLHRASALAKWLVLLSAVLLAILAWTPWALLAGYLALLLAAASCRLPLRPLLVLSLLPVPLVGLYALSRWDGSLATPLTIVSKGMVTAMAGLLVAATTPFPDLLAPATRVLPPVIADSLVLTYRAIFVLAGRVEALWLAIRARGGFFRRPAAGVLPWPARGTSLRRRFEVGTTGAALAVLRGADLSGRLYDVMRLRGYQGRLAPTRALALRRSDWQPLLLAGSLVALGLVARLTL
ncbi:MAG: energy-coupling factor transporter transmembrane component T [Chloroflexota bacterium]